MERDLQASRAELQSAAQEVRSSLESARTKRKQDWRLVQVGAACWLGGTIVWVSLSGPLARATPASLGAKGPETHVESPVRLSETHSGRRVDWRRAAVLGAEMGCCLWLERDESRLTPPVSLDSDA